MSQILSKTKPLMTREIFSDRRARLLLGGILIATVLIYLRSLGNGFVSDDMRAIVNNAGIGKWSFLWQSFLHDLFWGGNSSPVPEYRPLDEIWFAIHWHLGVGPAVWHATQIGLHLISVYMVYKIALRLSGARAAALLGASLFAFTPIHAEAVAWINTVPYPLSAAFQLGAFFLFITRSERRSISLPSLALYSASLLSYEGAVAFPGIIASYVYLLESPKSAPGADSTKLRARVRASLLCTAPFVAEVLLYLAVRRLVLGVLFTGSMGADQLADPRMITTTKGVLLTLPRVLASYAGLLLVPWSITLHRVSPVTSAEAPQFYLPLLGLGAIAVALRLLLREHPRRDLYLFCMAWTGVALVPMMNLRGLSRFSPDFLVCHRYLYMSSAGWCMLAGSWAADIARKSVAATFLVSSATAALLAVYASSLWSAQHFWHDDYTVAQSCVENFPDSALCHGSLGIILKESDPVAAERELKTALRLSTGLSLEWHENALSALAQIHAKQGRIEEAAGEVQQALHDLEMLPPDQRVAPAMQYCLLAELYDQEGQSQTSEAVLNHAKSLPGGAEAVDIARARIAWRHGEVAGAEAIVENLTSRYPGDPRVWILLGLAMEQEGREAQARSAYQRALAITPYDPQARMLADRALRVSAHNP